ncbi:MAG: hypothetical protein K2R98_09420 [Gemmataceae bacterium]|nr:hypothetical protein [Gemmataceae bacterium]
MNLVLIETAGNQSFIFATNKLRENVGASELTARVGTEFVLEGVREADGPHLQRPSLASIRAALRDRDENPPVGASNPVEVIVAVSGKALLLVRDEALGRKIVSHVTRLALKKAPGLDVRGVVGPPLDLARASIHDAIKHVHRQFDTVRSQLPGPAARFQRLPIVVECSTSGLPAARFTIQSDRLPKDEQGARSAQSLAKLAASEGWQTRLNGILDMNRTQVTLPFSTTEIENLECGWLAIVHADGNGLGQVFLGFDGHIAPTFAENPVEHNRQYIGQLRRFSLALDECTEKAFCHSLSAFRPIQGVTPVVPMVLGGDDLTVVCDGSQALQFTKKFIECFEEQTRNHADVKRIMSNGATSCAGVAIVKPHFPFFAGYELAEQLLQSAKRLGKKDPNQPRSAIDFHILNHGSGPDLDRIRQELRKDSASLVARPYLLLFDPASPRRSWDDLSCRIDAVRGRGEDGRRQLPNSMLHELRASLFLGRDVAEAQLRLVRDRYKPHIDGLLANGKLFWAADEQYMTGLLDALDVAEFWKGQSS